ncbi:TPA: hypothetical protein CPT84_01780, partial [Candidatus Gastranaerophilales bacterium HUM_12]
MSEYLSKEEIKQWRSSLEKITLEEFAARLGKKVEDTYLKYKTQIYFDECSDKNKEIGDGFTSGHNISTSIMCGDGIERPNLIARICTNKNNALDIYNIAHEFTHILLNENTKGKNISAENQEIATRFTEILLG